MNAAPRPTVLLVFAGVVVLMGANFVAVRMSNMGLAPTWGAALRFGIAAAILWTILLARGIPIPQGSALIGAALFGTLAFGIFFGLIYWGLVQVPAAIGATATATIPLMTLFVAVVMRVERFRVSALLGALIVIGGVFLLVGGGSAAQASHTRIAAVFVACIAAAVAGVVVKRFPRSHPVATNAVGMTVAAMLLLAASAVRGEVWMAPADPRTRAAFAYLVASSLLLFPMFVWLIREWTASASAYTGVLAPLVTAPLAALIVGETMHSTFILAALIIGLGVYIGVLRKPRTVDAGAAVPGKRGPSTT